MKAGSVAILIPMHDSAPYIGRLLKQVHEQTSSFDEVLCYDDGSSDDSARIAEEMGAIVIRSDTPRRQSYARNVLWRSCRSEFVHFHDHDDPLSPNFLARMRPRLSPDCITICPCKEVRGDEVTHHVPSTKGGRHGLVFEQFVHLNSMIVARSLVERVGGFDEDLTLYEEKLFLLRLLAADGKVQLAMDAESEWCLSTTTSFMLKQGWLGNAKMFRPFVERAVPLVPAEARESFLKYVLYKCWLYSNEEPACDTDVDAVLGHLKQLRLTPVRGLGTKTELLIRLLGPGRALRVRRWRSRLGRGKTERRVLA